MIERDPIPVELPPHCDREHFDVDTILQTARGRRGRAESVGEADGGLRLSIGYRAEIFASIEEVLFPRALRKTDHVILELRTHGMGGMASQGLLAGVNSRSEVIESKSDCHSSCIASCRILAANLPNSQCCKQT